MRARCGTGCARVGDRRPTHSRRLDDAHGVVRRVPAGAVDSGRRPMPDAPGRGALGLGATRSRGVLGTLGTLETLETMTLWRLLTGTLARYLLLLVNIAVGVFLMPFTIRHLGT